LINDIIKNIIKNNNNYNLFWINKLIDEKFFSSISLKIKVTKVKTKDITIYYSITSITKSLNIDQASIFIYLNDKHTKPFKGKTKYY
jgi:hypothetical protein